MPKNELFEKIANQSLKLKENDDDNSSFLNKIHNKLIDLFNYLYKESEPEEWTGIISDALNNSDIPDQELKVIKDSLVDELLFY